MRSLALNDLSHNKYYNWIVRNFFSTWLNTFLTIIALIFLYKVGTFFLDWAIFSADFKLNFQVVNIQLRQKCMLIS